MDPFGSLGVGLGGNCDCSGCGILYAAILGGGSTGLVSLHLLLNIWNFLFPAGGVFCLQGFAMCA